MTEYKNFVIIVPSFNNSQWYEKNLQSVCNQNYSNYRIIYTDDASKDNTADLVENFIKNNNLQNKIKLIKNTENKGALHNIYDMIHSCEDNEISLTVDGDDWLPHDSVLSRLNHEYQNTNVWMTYGSYIDFPGMSRGCCKPYNQNDINNNNYRRLPWRASHLRSWYTKLFKLIKKEDFMHNGKFFSSAWDLAINFPCLEMCGNKCSYINDILYVYNNQNPISDFRIKQHEQSAFDRIIRCKNKYTLLQNLW